MDGSQLRQSSSIPWFLLDAQHPWVIKHQSLLERLPDVESFLHSAPGTKYRTPTSQLQHHDASARPAPTDDEPDPDLEVPADLFTTLNINNNRSHTPRAGGYDWAREAAVGGAAGICAADPGGAGRRAGAEAAFGEQAGGGAFL